MNAASLIPSAVLISTSSSTSFDCAAEIEPAAAASPAAADRATELAPRTVIQQCVGSLASLVINCHYEPSSESDHLCRRPDGGG